MDNEISVDLTTPEQDIMLKQLLNIGEAMYCAGAEIHKIEKTLHYLGKAYGAEYVNVYAITSSIVITMEYTGKPSITQSRRITKRVSLDLAKLESLDSLCVSCIKDPLSLDDLCSKVATISQRPLNSLKIFIGELLAASAFTIFFGGTIHDAFVALLGAILIYMLQKYLAPLCYSALFFNTAASFVAGAAICYTCHYLPFLHSDKIMIGDIMVLIPGIAITNAIRYTISGDSISGMEKLVDSVLQGCAIAVGFSLAIYLLQ